MEALRKAEAAKRQVQEEQALAAAAPTPDAAAPDAEAAAPSPAARSLSLEERDVLQRATEQELEEYLNHPHDPDEMAFPSRIPTLTSPVNTATPLDRQAAASLFSAKAGSRVREDSARKTRTAMLAGIALLLIPAWFAVAWYLEQQGSSSLGLDPALANVDLRGREFAGEEPVVPAPAQPAVGTAPAPAPEPGATPDPAEDAGTPEPAVADPVPATPPPVTQTAGAPPETTATAAALMPDNGAAASAPATAPALTLEITRSAGNASVDPQLQEAYSRFRAGELDDAARRYQAVIDQSPGNRDALLGLGAIALQQQNPAQARAYYSRLLALNPQDHLARTGLMQSLSSLGAAERETTLRNMLAAAPGASSNTSSASAPLHFALGNLYAQQQRWQDAQAAYFNALLQARRSTAEPVNPDYAFNLAISLERLGQSKAAVEYYREAQNLARTTRGSFDTTLLNQRLATLEQTLP
jgi:tetratricopeptide (TPR) repeat protein